MSRLHCLSAALCAGFLPPVHAATLLAYSFDGSGNAFSNAPVELAPGLTAGAWSDADGTLTSFTGNPGRALGARGFHDGNRLLLSVSTTALLRPTRLHFDQQASTSGPRQWKVFANGLRIASGIPTTSFGAVDIPLDLGPLPLLELALEGSGASSSQGTWRIDNLRLEGSVQASPVPLPATVGMLAGALSVLPLRRPKRRTH